MSGYSSQSHLDFQIEQIQFLVASKFSDLVDIVLNHLQISKLSGYSSRSLPNFQIELIQFSGCLKIFRLSAQSSQSSHQVEQIKFSVTPRFQIEQIQFAIIQDFRLSRYGSQKLAFKPLPRFINHQAIYMPTFLSLFLLLFF